MRRIATLTTLLAACVIAAAPVPPAKVRGFRPGLYLASWGNTKPCRTCFHADGWYVCSNYFGVTYTGSWRWCPARRVLTVCETSSGSHYSVMEFAMDARASTGVSSGNYTVVLSPDR